MGRDTLIEMILDDFNTIYTVAWAHGFENQVVLRPEAITTPLLKKYKELLPEKIKFKESS